jgi:hypothetical protein
MEALSGARAIIDSVASPGYSKNNPGVCVICLADLMVLELYVVEKGVIWRLQRIPIESYCLSLRGLNGTMQSDPKEQ